MLCILNLGSMENRNTGLMRHCYESASLSAVNPFAKVFLPFSFLNKTQKNA
jgi:hypothetical protein